MEHARYCNAWYPGTGSGNQYARTLDLYFFPYGFFIRCHNSVVLLQACYRRHPEQICASFGKGVTPLDVAFRYNPDPIVVQHLVEW